MKRSNKAFARGSMDILQWFSLTAMINEIKGPQFFLKNLLFGREQTFNTEVLEIDYLVGGKVMAPFVRKNGEALIVGGLGSTKATVEAPNIRIKRPFTPSELLFDRKPSTVVFPTAGEQMSALEAHVARDMAYMESQIVNAEEWLAAMALRGTIEYEVEDEEVFTITFPKPAAHTATLGTLWSAVSTPEVDILAAKRLIAAATGLAPTHMILGQNAAEAFLGNARVETLLDNRRIRAGNVLYDTQFDTQGGLYLGDFCGLQVWEYASQIEIAGTDTSLVRADYAEIVAAVPAAEWKTYYAAIADHKALKGRLFQGKRFAKSWEQEDPSVLWALAASRPLCVPRRPGASVSYEVA